MKRRLFITFILVVALCFTTCVVYAEDAIEYTWEEEPNDYIEDANYLEEECEVLGVMETNDIDIYKFEVEARSEIVIACVAQYDTAILCVVDSEGIISEAVYCDYYIDGYYAGVLSIERWPDTDSYIAVYDEMNNVNIYSVYYEAVPLDPLLPPDAYSYKDNDTGKPCVYWPSIGGADYYEVWRSVGNSDNFSKYYTTTATSMNNISAEVGVEYHYKVRAICKDDSELSSQFGYSTSIVCGLPSPKNTVVYNNVSSGKPKITWDAVEGADKYYVYRARSKHGDFWYLGSTTNTHYTNTGAIAGNTYYYSVVAVISSNEAANSKHSDRCYITCDLPQPTNVKVNNNASSGKPKVTWTAVEGADKYYVYRATSKNGTYSYLGSTANTHYTNTGAVAGKTYYYKVKAVDVDNEYANSALSDSCYITCDLAKPTNVKVTLSNDKPKVTWNKVEGATKYEVYRKVGENGTYSKYYTTVYNSFTNTSATKGTKYYYKVVAVCKTSTYGNSAYSNAVSITSK